MPPLLTTSAMIMCAHGGKVMTIPTQAKVLIDGAPVLVVPGLMGAPIVGCAIPPTPVTKPCLTVVAVMPGSWSMKALIGGQPAYWQSLVGLTDGVPPGPIQCVFPGQVRVQG